MTPVTILKILNMCLSALKVFKVMHTKLIQNLYAKIQHYTQYILVPTSSWKYRYMFIFMSLPSSNTYVITYY